MGTAMNAKRPLPLLDIKPRPKCPVCGHASYSRAGIHPQCSRQLADQKRMERVKARRKAAPPKAKPPTSNALKAWHKRCPKCRAEVHIRRAHCECGFRFGTRRVSE